MTGEQITLSIVVFLLLYFSVSFGRHWLHEHYEARRQARELWERAQLSEEETKRAEIMANALAIHPALRPLADSADDGKQALVRGTTHVKRARVLGVDVDSEMAHAIVSKPREAGRGQRLDGTFEVVEISTENPEGFVGRLRNSRTSEEFSVEMNFSDLTEEDINTLFSSTREKKPIQIWVNAWFIGDKMTARRRRPRDPNQLAKLVVDIATGQTEDKPEPRPQDAGKDPAAVSLGRRGGLRGGKARAAKLDPEKRSRAEISN